MSPETNNNLPTGFISMDKAIELINSDTRSNPVVDMDYMVARLKWVEVGRTFRIPRIRRLSADEVYRTKRGKLVEFEQIGSEYVLINDLFEQERLKKTLRDKWRDMVGHEYNEIKIKATSTVADDAQGKEAVRPRVNTPIAQAGQSIGSGEMITTNGQNLTV